MVFKTILFFSYWLLFKDKNLIIPFLWGYTISFILSAGFGLDAFYQEFITEKGLNNVSKLGHYNKVIVWIVNSFITGAFAATYLKKSSFCNIFNIFFFFFYYRDLEAYSY